MRPGLSFVNRERELSEMTYSVIVNILRPQNESKYRVLVSSQHLGSGKTILCSELCERIAQLSDGQKEEYLTQFNNEFQGNAVLPLPMDKLLVLGKVKHIYIDLRLYEVLFRNHQKNTPLTQTIVFIVLDAILFAIGDKALHQRYQQDKQSGYDLASICGIFEAWSAADTLLIIHLDEIDQILRIGAEPYAVLPPEDHNERFHHLLVAVTSMANTKHTLYLSGRSPHIFKLGLGLPPSIDDAVTTPVMISIISLVLDSLNAAHVAKLLPSDFVDTWREHFEANNAPVTFEEYVVIRTGGVPRLIIFAYLYLRKHQEHLNTSEVNVLGQGFLIYLLNDVSGAKEVLSFTSLSEEDQRIYFRLAEWSHFQLPLKLAGKFDLSVIGVRDEVDLPMLLRRWQVYMEKVDSADDGSYREANEYVRLVFPAVVLESAATHPSYREILSGTLLDNIRDQFTCSGHLWNPELAVELLPLKTIARHFCLPIGSCILGDHFPFFKKGILGQANMKILRGYRMPKMVKAEGSGGAKVLRIGKVNQPVSDEELLELQKNKQDNIEDLKAFFTSPRGSRSTNLNYKDMELLRKLAPMNGYFTPTEKSSSADAWIRWQGLSEETYELFIQAKSYQRITAKLVRDEVDKVVFSADEHVKACFLMVSLNDNVSQDDVKGFEPILDDENNTLAYHILPEKTITYIVKSHAPREEKDIDGEDSAKDEDVVKSTKKRKHTSSGASTHKQTSYEEHLTLPKNVEVVVLTAAGVRALVSHDTWDFMTKSLHSPPVIARTPSVVKEEDKEENKEDEKDQDEKDEDKEDEEEEELA